MIATRIVEVFAIRFDSKSCYLYSGCHCALYSSVEFMNYRAHCKLTQKIILFESKGKYEPILFFILFQKTYKKI